MFGGRFLFNPLMPATRSRRLAARRMEGQGQSQRLGGCLCPRARPIHTPQRPCPRSASLRMTAHREAPFSHSLPCASHLLATTFAGWLYFSEPISAPRTDAHPGRLHTQRIWGNGSHHVPKRQSGADSVWEQLN